MSTLYQPLIEGVPKKSTSAPTLFSVSVVCLCHLAVTAVGDRREWEWVAAGHTLGLVLAALGASRWTGKSTKVSLAVVAATFGAYSVHCLVTLQLLQLTETLALMLWASVFTHLFARRPASFSQYLRQLSLQLLGLVLSISVAAFLLDSLFPRGLFGGVSLCVVYFMLLLKDLDLDVVPPVEQTPQVPGIQKKVARDCTPIKELMDYLGTLEGGKVDIELFLPILATQCPDLPPYVKKALQQFQHTKTETATFADILHAADQMYNLQTKSQAPAQIRDN